MPEQRRDGTGTDLRSAADPAADSGMGYELRVEVHWCRGCGADSVVQIVQLATDPQPVAVCADCGAGLAVWLAADDPAGYASVQQGAA